MKTIRRTTVTILAALTLTSTGTGTVQATERTTVAPGHWTNSATWTDGIFPSTDDTVEINHDVTLDTSPPALAEIRINTNKTFTFIGWDTVLTASVVHVYGEITHPEQSATEVDPVSGEWVPDNRVYIVCTNLALYEDGKIDVDGKGYINTNINAEAAGAGDGSIARSGAGHGGVGGRARWPSLQPPGPAYGVAESPVQPGSAGGSTTFSGSKGGNGGGAVRIKASGIVTVDGSITANGATISSFAGAGSGGSIFIECDVLTDSKGVISAEGGNPTYSHLSGPAGGGGGRIAVLYDGDSQGQAPIPDIIFSVSGRANTSDTNYGDIGTLYFPDDRFLFAESIRHSGQWIVPGVTQIDVPQLIITNAWLRFMVPDLTLAVTGDLEIFGQAAYRSGRLELDAIADCNVGGDVLVTRGALKASPVFNVGKDLVLSQAEFRIQSAPESFPGEDYGALLAVGGEMRILDNSWIFPSCDPTNGIPPKFTVHNMTISTNSGIDASSLGYMASPTVNGLYGPEAGTSRSGGGHGGAGGQGASGTPGGTYGEVEMPITPGSAGGGHVTAHVGGNGGGVVWVEAMGTIAVEGTINVNGEKGKGSGASGGGAGGSIYLRARRFQGDEAAMLSAVGGEGGSSSGGGGGGGRIAVWRQQPLDIPSIGTDFRGGEGVGTGESGDGGTIHWGLIPPTGTLILVR